MSTLYVVATPIGNLEDITLRALRVLREVALIATEDTRTARHLLDHYGIATPLTSYWEHNELARLPKLLETLETRDVALISEAGTPGISDPGFRLVHAAAERGFPVCVVPGPSSVVAAVAVAGLPTEHFLFLGFLPRAAKARRKLLQEAKGVQAALVLLEAPHRLVASLGDMLEFLGDREVAIARELTKVYEEVWRGHLAQALEHFRAKPPRGEFTLVVERGSTEPERWAEVDALNATARLIAAGLPTREAFREVAQLAGWSRREVYESWLRRSKAQTAG